jgi:hypothetical protein
MGCDGHIYIYIYVCRSCVSKSFGPLNINKLLYIRPHNPCIFLHIIISPTRAPAQATGTAPSSTRLRQTDTVTRRNAGMRISFQQKGDFNILTSVI